MLFNKIILTNGLGDSTLQSKTKIVVLHLKELIYTGIFIVLGILFIVLLIMMFMPKDAASSKTASASDAAYTPGIYSSSLVLNDMALNIEVTLDENNINSIRLVNLDEAVATMYPLIEPSFADLTTQIYENQSLDGITYSDDNKYTSLVLLEAIEASISKARIESPAEPDTP